MEDEVKILMKKLGQVINETLTESPQLNLLIQSIRDSGYEVFLMIEASVGFNKKSSPEKEVCQGSVREAAKVELKMTPEDAKFLKSLKISIDS